MIKGFLIDYGGGYNEAVDTPEDLKRIYSDYLNDHYKNPYLTKRQVEQAENILADYEAIFYEAESIGPLWDYETFDNTFGFNDALEKAERLRHRDKLKALDENINKDYEKTYDYLTKLVNLIREWVDHEIETDALNELQSMVIDEIEDLEVFPASLDDWLWDLLQYTTQIGKSIGKFNRGTFNENTNYHDPYDERNLDYLQSELRNEVQRLEDLLIYGANGVYEGREYKGYERDDFTKAELDMLVIPYEVDFDADGYPIIRYRRA